MGKVNQLKAICRDLIISSTTDHYTRDIQTAKTHLLLISMLAPLLFSLGVVNSEAHAGTIYGAPFHSDFYYATILPFSTIDEAVNDWWANYQSVYAYAFPGCSYARYDDPNGQTTGHFAGLPLFGTCGGGGTIYGTPYPYDPGKNEGTPNVCGGNPINLATGAKFQIEHDYDGVIGGQLAFNRYYSNSKSFPLAKNGQNWRNTYDRKLALATANTGTSGTVYVYREDGKSYTFKLSGTAWIADADIADKLIQSTDTYGNQIGWHYLVAQDDSVEEYDATGKLLTITSRAGLIQKLSYSNGSGGILYGTTPSPSGYVAPACQGVTGVMSSVSANALLCATGQFGQQLNFSYDTQGRLNAFADPNGNLYQFGYSTGNDLASVIYPDNKTRTYLYNEPAYTSGVDLPHNLTGLMDENNVRFATWRYNTSGGAISSEHAVGVEKVTVTYSVDGAGSPTSTTMTDALGTVRTTNFQTVLGVVKGAGTSQPGGAGCNASSNGISYDTNGNVATRTDFNGNLTMYTYDLTRNLETSRTEASGTAQARIITTSWHPTYRLPAVIAEPLRKTTFTYDGSGNLLNKTVQATTDTTGSQGLSAQTTGTPRIWSYTYNQFGQVLTATGPRTDTVDKTTYAYDSTTGNLLTITNAAGQVTTLSNYDANGRVGTITDANGLTTNLTYYPRGWLKSKVVSTAGSSQTTSYSYDGVGQLKNVTLPDNSTITYTYDDAHRLTDIADSLNNRIHYTLDNMGNRISEQVNDPGNVLTRQTTRIYDALNRLQQVTGAPQ